MAAAHKCSKRVCGQPTARNGHQNPAARSAFTRLSRNDDAERWNLIAPLFATPSFRIRRKVARTVASSSSKPPCCSDVDASAEPSDLPLGEITQLAVSLLSSDISSASLRTYFSMPRIGTPPRNSGMRGSSSNECDTRYSSDL